jgi:hypothetical protein
MSTTQQLLKRIDSKYPSATSDTVKIEYMNEAQHLLSSEFGRVVTDTSIVTEADNDEYTLPTGIEDISQIETFDVSNNVPELDKIVVSTNMKVGAYTLADQPDYPSRISITHTSVGTVDTLGTVVLVGTSGGETVTETLVPIANTTIYSDKFYSAVTSLTGAGWSIVSTNDTIKMGIKADRYDTNRYNIGYKDEKPMSARCIYQLYSSTGTKSLIIYPAPSVADLQVTIRYHAKLTELSITSLDASPDFDSDFHGMLVSYACWQICANGSSPDSVQANRFAAEYDQWLEQLWTKTYKEQMIAPRKRKDNRQWHNDRTHGWSGDWFGGNFYV